MNKSGCITFAAGYGLGFLTLFALMLVFGDYEDPPALAEAPALVAQAEVSTETPTLTATPIPEAQDTEAVAVENSPTPEPTATETLTPVPSQTPVATATETPQPTATHTAEPTPTWTPTATETPVPTIALSPFDALRANVEEALGSGNRDVPRITSVRYDEMFGIVHVEWALNLGWDEEALRRSARMDAAKVLKAVHESGLVFDFMNLTASTQTTDSFGVSEETPVVWYTFEYETLQRINWQDESFVNFVLHQRIDELADTVNIHSALIP